MKNINLINHSSLFKQKIVGKSKICGKTDFSGALDNSKFHGKTILLEFEDSKYIYISGLEIFEFMTSDNFVDYISLMGNSMAPYVLAVGSRYSYFISTQYKFIANDKNEESTLLISSDDSLDPNDYHLVSKSC